MSKVQLQVPAETIVWQMECECGARCGVIGVDDATHYPIFCPFCAARPIVQRKHIEPDL